MQSLSISKRQPALVAVALLSASWVWGQQGTTAVSPRSQEASPNSQVSLGQEIRRLRIELLELRIENESATVAALESGRSKIETEQLKITETEQGLPQQAANIYAALDNQSSSPEQRMEVDRMKETFSSEQTERLNQERSSLQVRERKNSGALQLERQRLESLETRRKQLTNSE